MTHDMENGRRTHAGIFKNGETDLTRGGITGSILMFAFPMIAGNLLQQCYNIADTIIVGRFAGPDALAAVGSSYTLMTFLLSVIIGLCMGSGNIQRRRRQGRTEKKRLHVIRAHRNSIPVHNRPDTFTALSCHQAYECA